jgi:response regulator RpfG family c-di-GMP phosphodiesterase
MKKILIVEDNSDYREIMTLFITKMGYRAIQAKNSYEAIAFAEAEEPDLKIQSCNWRGWPADDLPRIKPMTNTVSNLKTAASLMFFNSIVTSEKITSLLSKEVTNGCRFTEVR